MALFKKRKNEPTRQPYVKYETVWNAVGGGLNTPGESKVCRVGKHKVLLERSSKLNKYGNPVHTATVINEDGSLGDSYRGAGSATLIAGKALEKSGVKVKHNNPYTKKK